MVAPLGKAIPPSDSAVGDFLKQARHIDVVSTGFVTLADDLVGGDCDGAAIALDSVASESAINPTVVATVPIFSMLNDRSTDAPRCSAAVWREIDESFAKLTVITGRWP